MSAFLRKCRGVLGIGLTWAIGWAAVFAALWAGIRIFDPASIDPGEGLARTAWIGGVFGFISGAAFAVLLALADGRKTLRDLSPLRAALWGAVGTAAFPLLTAVNDSMVVIVCPIGALFAAASVAVARRAALDAPPEHPRLPS